MLLGLSLQIFGLAGINGGNMSHQWLTPAQCIGLSGVPGTIPGIHKMAKREGWVSRRREGVQGGAAIEFSLNSLPPLAQAQFIKQVGCVTISGKDYTLKKPQGGYSRE